MTGSARDQGEGGAAATRELMRRMVTDDDADPFDLLVDNSGFGLREGLAIRSPAGRKMVVAYLDRHGSSAIADYLKTALCLSPDDDRGQQWIDFPEEFRALAAEFAARGRAARLNHTECTPAGNHEGDVGRPPARTETPLPPALQLKHAEDEAPVIPPAARKALAGRNIVRYSDSPEGAAAISLSTDVDPVGEVSGGGYWLYLSPDHGATWDLPLYLGLQHYEPYVVVSRSRLPLIRGRTLQIEVEVNELDPESIMFPPVALRPRRQARDLYIEMSLDDLRRDSDGDGLTDLLEDKLRTDPHDADTDHDGLRDDVDPLPQVSIAAPPVPDWEVIRVSLHTIFGYDYAAIGTGGPVAGDRSTEDVVGTALRAASAARGHVDNETLFVRGDKSLFQGLRLPHRVVVVAAAEARELRAKYGIFYPVGLQVLFNRSRTKALVVWSASWVGGTLLFQRSEGRWQPPSQSRWIT